MEKETKKFLEDIVLVQNMNYAWNKLNPNKKETDDDYEHYANVSSQEVLSRMKRNTVINYQYAPNYLRNVSCNYLRFIQRNLFIFYK